MIIEYLLFDSRESLFTDYNADYVARVGDHIMVNGYEYIVHRVLLDPHGFIEAKIFVRDLTPAEEENEKLSESNGGQVSEANY